MGEPGNGGKVRSSEVRCQLVNLASSIPQSGRQNQVSRGQMSNVRSQ